jgi:hypothetical protein
VLVAIPFNKTDLTPQSLNPSTTTSQKKQKVLTSKRKTLQQAETIVTFLDPVIMRDNEQEANYNSVLKRKRITTRFVCQNTLRTLGLIDDVYELLEKK